MATGSRGDGGHIKSNEVLDLTNNFDCQNLKDLEEGREGAAGGVLGLDKMIICGGHDPENHTTSTTAQCLQITQEEIMDFGFMETERMFAASTNLDKETLWVLGGRNSNWQFTDSTEFIFANGTIVNGPDMPLPLFRHTMTKITDDSGILVGGDNESGFKKSTYFFDIPSMTWTPGPPLISARGLHTTSVIADQITGEKYVLVCGGKPEASCEYLSLKDPFEWKFGGEIPHGRLYGHSAVTLDGVVMVIGGYNQSLDKFEDSVYMVSMHNEGLIWTKMDQTLKSERAHAVAFHIPKPLELVTCTSNLL